MDARHAPDFELALIAALEVYDAAPPSDQVLRLWWDALEPFPWELVQAALTEHTRRCKFKPRPADILERLEVQDGRPTADEAWAIALQAQDEAATVVWTDETAAAWGIALPVLDAGDEVGARKTFLSAYERLTTAARVALRPVRWTPSLGTDVAAREAALRRAEEQGRLRACHVKELLPPDPEADPGIAAIAGLLAGKVLPLPDLKTREARRYLAAIKDGLRAATERERAEKEAELQCGQCDREREAARKAITTP